MKNVKPLFYVVISFERTEGTNDNSYTGRFVFMEDSSCRLEIEKCSFEMPLKDAMKMLLEGKVKTPIETEYNGKKILRVYDQGTYKKDKGEQP